MHRTFGSTQKQRASANEPEQLLDPNRQRAHHVRHHIACHATLHIPICFDSSMIPGTLDHIVVMICKQHDRRAATPGWSEYKSMVPSAATRRCISLVKMICKILIIHITVSSIQTINRMSNTLLKMHFVGEEDLRIRPRRLGMGFCENEYWSARIVLPK